MGFDAFFFVTIFAVSIACAVRETQLVALGVPLYYNRGAFGAAAVN